MLKRRSDAIYLTEMGAFIARRINYILSCLQDLVENGVEIKPDSDLVNDLGLESIKVMDLLMMLEDRFDISIPINILLDVKTPAQLMETLLPWLEIK